MFTDNINIENNNKEFEEIPESNDKIKKFITFLMLFDEKSKVEI